MRKLTLFIFSLLLLNVSADKTWFPTYEGESNFSVTPSGPKTESTADPNRPSPGPRPVDQQAVSLVFPTFIGASVKEDESGAEEGIIQMSLRTRASLYNAKLQIVDQSDKISLKLVDKIGTDGAWLEPLNIMDQKTVIDLDSTEMSLDEIRARASNYLKGGINLVSSQTNSSGNEQSEPFWAFRPVSSRFQHNGKEYVLILRDNLMVLFSGDKYYFRKYPDEFVKDEAFQIYSMETIVQGDVIYVFAFDAIGTATVTVWNLANIDAKDNKISFMRKADQVSLSAPLEGSKKFNLEQFKKDLDRKKRSNFLEAIISVPGETNGTSSAGLCVVNGYKLPAMDYISPNVPIMCKSQDKSLNNILPRLEASKRIVIYAMHMSRSNSNIYFHIIFTRDVLPPEFIYRFLAVKVESKDSPVDLNASSADDVVLGYTPNDIVGYKTPTCNKMIVFYDILYSVHKPDEKISWTAINALLNQDISFHIAAAMAIENQFYFFTHTNKLVMMKGELEGCGNNLKFSTKKEMYSQDFLMSGLFGVPDSKPYLLDYRQIDDKKISPSEDVTLTELPKDDGDSSTIIIVVFALIIGGLILAALLYVFCLRNSDGDQDGPARISSRKSRKNAMGKSKSHKGNLNPDHSLHTLTVRSGVTSGSSAKTPSSMMKQEPIVKVVISSPSRSPTLSSKLARSPSRANSPSRATGSSPVTTSSPSPKSKASASKAYRPGSPLKSGHSPSKSAKGRASSPSTPSSATAGSKHSSQTGSKRSSPSTSPKSQHSHKSGKSSPHNSSSGVMKTSPLGKQ